MSVGFAEYIENEKKKEYYIRLNEALDREYAGHTVFPARENIFQALEATELSDVRAVIIGQDPYHEPEQAHGLAFSVLPEQKKLPPSLKNIYKELNAELGIPVPATGYLMPWAKRGVLLLNSVLTVRMGEPRSHAKLGWQTFTDGVISLIDRQKQPVVYLLWGNDAIKKKELLKNPGHLVLTAAHPSPLSASRGFFGCGHFLKVNEYLRKSGSEEIDWAL